MVYYLPAICHVHKQKATATLELQSGLLHTLSDDDLLNVFYFLGDQVFYLWNNFLNFHRFAFTSRHYHCIQTSILNSEENVVDFINVSSYK